eukprot:tig00020710_g13328.t1
MWCFTLFPSLSRVASRGLFINTRYAIALSAAVFLGMYSSVVGFLALPAKHWSIVRLITWDSSRSPTFHCGLELFCVDAEEVFSPKSVFGFIDEGCVKYRGVTGGASTEDVLPEGDLALTERERAALFAVGQDVVGICWAAGAASVAALFFTICTVAVRRAAFPVLASFLNFGAAACFAAAMVVHAVRGGPACLGLASALTRDVNPAAPVARGAGGPVPLVAAVLGSFAAGCIAAVTHAVRLL